jgi:nucleotide-binding universal stress UspA family protein
MADSMVPIKIIKYMKTILFPTDFSENAHHAAQYAAMVAKILNAKICLFHAYTLPLIGELQLTYEIESILMSFKTDAEKKLDDFTKTFVKNTSFPIHHTTQIAEGGDIAVQILLTAKAITADMILMGTKGATNALDKWLGTNASKVMKKAECPVWIIPQKAQIKYPANIMYCADYGENEVAATHKVVNITKALGASCKVIHVHDYYDLNVGHSVEAMEVFLEDEFKHDDVVFRHVTRADITSGLDKYIDTHKPDVLALAVRDKSFFARIFEPSITNHFVFGANLPIITFKK